MEMSVVVLICTLLTILGIVMMVKSLTNNRKSTDLSVLHGVLTLAVFGVFTGYITTGMPSSANNWPMISYMFYAVAGIVAVIALFADKLFELKLPKWVTVSYGTLEIFGYATLMVTVFTVTG